MIHSFLSIERSLKLSLALFAIALLSSCTDEGTEVPFATDLPSANAFIYNEVQERRSTQFSTETAFIQDGPIAGSNVKLLTFASALRVYSPQLGDFEVGSDPLIQMSIGDTDDNIIGIYTVEDDGNLQRQEGEVDAFIRMEIAAFTELEGIYLTGGTLAITEQNNNRYLFEYRYQAEWSQYDPFNHTVERKEVEILGKFEGPVITL